ncbi:MAG TPA: vanadium-dependent haloperoxidase [Candidatus Eisenbacteria bacterium]|nr:vanadium-dependent haloperoxidase [Candidatus Eisenbacteria bacterium]
MSKQPRRLMIALLLVLAVPTLLAASARADAVTEANAKAAAITAKAPTPVAARALCLTQVAVYEAVAAITGRLPHRFTDAKAARGASLEAAVAAATRTVLAKLVPGESAAVEADYQAALAAVPDGPQRRDGIAAGEAAAAAVLALRENDGSMAPDRYRPYTAPGVYVPTVVPMGQTWGARKPWLLSKPDQFRPGPPPALDSETWAKDYNEIKEIGSKESAKRTPEQTAIARFWTATNPVIYWPIVRSVAAAPGRDLVENARLLAAAAIAMDDAIIAVFDGKYAYNFWRPMTAIRNGDLDKSDATVPDPGWTPFIDTPLHPEYPCAHCIVSGSLGGLIEAELNGAPSPTLSTSSPTADGAVRSWKTVGDFVKEVAEARIYDGVHYRNSTVVGTEMGLKIGALAAQALPRASR